MTRELFAENVEAKPIVIKNIINKFFIIQSFERHFMNRLVFLSVILLAVSSRAVIYGISPNRAESLSSNQNDQDTLQKQQVLYNGILWEKRYHRVEEDEYLFSDIFLPGTISINGMKFNNLRIRYDLYCDEIMIPLYLKGILQLNKEMVDSFTISFENKEYHFINIKDETFKGLAGYVNVLYNGKSALYVKYRKEILLTGAIQYYIGRLYQTSSIYFVKDNIVNAIKSKNDLYKILNEQKTQIRNFITDNKLKVSIRIPDSFVPVIRYYDNIRQ